MVKNGGHPWFELNRFVLKNIANARGGIGGIAVHTQPRGREEDGVEGDEGEAPIPRSRTSPPGASADIRLHLAGALSQKAGQHHQGCDHGHPGNLPNCVGLF